MNTRAGTMTNKRGDDQHGYDPKRHAARTLLDRLEQQVDQRPARPARKLGDVLKLPKVTPTTKRLIDSSVRISADPPTLIDFQHTVFCQVGLPYRPTTQRVWEREQGNIALRIEAGVVRDPRAKRWIDLPLPHGEKPRLILIHLNGEALRTGSPVIDVEDSMTAFVRALGVDTNGRNLRTLKDQLARLSASTVRLSVAEDGRAVQINGQVIGAFDLWFPPDADQRVLWPTTVRLSADYFDSLTRHAVPLDSRAVAALAHSALDLDVYAWLAQRLHRVPKGKPQTITWQALKAQFGPDYARLIDFRRKFVPALKTVLTVYPSARIEVTDAGLMLWNSPPPVMKRLVSVPRLDRPTIDGTATEITDT
jgi:hypothetical protein